MVFGGVPGEFAGGSSLGDGGVEVPPLVVAEEVLEVTREPVFYAGLGLLGVGFEGGGEGLDDLGVHGLDLGQSSFIAHPSSCRFGAARSRIPRVLLLMDRFRTFGSTPRKLVFIVACGGAFHGFLGLVESLHFLLVAARHAADLSLGSALTEA